MRSPAALIFCLLSLGISAALAESRKPDPKSPLMIRGREVTGLIVTAPIPVGSRLPPGLPTVPIYTVRPNRLVPVREDITGVYFQAESAFAEIGGGPGGLFVSRTPIDEIYAYRGDGRYPKIYLPFLGRVQPGDLLKVRVQFKSQQKRK
jgi:hypothetical protein